MPSDRVARIRELVPERPVIVLKRRPDLAGHILDVQTYLMDGEDVMPIFSSAKALRESLAGEDLARPFYEIERSLLVKCLRGEHIVLVDPRLPTQFRFTTSELREAFPPDDGGI